MGRRGVDEITGRGKAFDGPSKLCKKRTGMTQTDGLCWGEQRASIVIEGICPSFGKIKTITQAPRLGRFL